MKAFAVSWLAVIFLLTGCKKDVSGTYLAADDAEVYWLQLVRTPDDHLAGQLVLSVLKTDGKIDQTSRSLSGAVNGQNLTITTGSFLGLAAATFSGTFAGETLTLTGTEATPLVLRRANLDEYQSQLANQKARSRKIILDASTAAARRKAELSQENFVTEADHVIFRMKRFEDTASRLDRFKNVERNYEAITAKVHEYVTQERKLSGDTRWDVARSQLDVRATEVSLNNDQLHNQMQTLQSSFEVNVGPLIREVDSIEQACHRAAESEPYRSTCNHFMSTTPPFHQICAATKSSFDHLEAIYKREAESQARLLAIADKLQ